MIWTVVLAVSIPNLIFALPEVKQCPRKEDIKHCHCRVYDSDTFIETRIECKPMHVNELRKAFVNLRGNKNLHITIDSFWMMDKLPSDLFKGLDVVKLEFQYHNIVRFGDEGKSSFEGLENTLKELYIHNSEDEKPLEYLNVTALNVLHTLDIVVHGVPTLGNDLFAKGPVSLKKLKIWSYKTREIGDKVFRKLVNLEYLSVMLTTFGDFRRSMLPSPAPYLEHLDLSLNRISSLPEDMFVDMPSLRTVRLEYNQITRLPEATWSAVWSKLRQLYLKGNPLECDNHIEWMFRKRRPEYIGGTCEAPEYRKGKDLETVIRDH